jgi:hypothetical protein
MGVHGGPSAEGATFTLPIHYEVNYLKMRRESAARSSKPHKVLLSRREA